MNNIMNNMILANADYLAPLEKFKGVLLAVVGAFGAIILIYGIVKFAESFQKKDQSGEYQAAYTIGAGVIMIGASLILTALGI